MDEKVKELGVGYGEGVRVPFSIGEGAWGFLGLERRVFRPFR